MTRYEHVLGHLAVSLCNRIGRQTPCNNRGLRFTEKSTVHNHARNKHRAAQCKWALWASLGQRRGEEGARGFKQMED